MALFLLVACSPPSSYRYELVLEVDTPEGLRTGSAVVEVTVRREPRPLPDMSGQNSQVRGEAVAVDLPGGQTLFATLAGENSGGYAEGIAAYSLVPARLTSIDHLEERMAILSEAGREAPVPRVSYPLLVRFRDIRDPGTIEAVNPDDLAASFGPGVRLRRILIRTTSAAPAFRLGSRLSWLGPGFQGAVHAVNGVTYRLNSSAFQRR
jgi:hypothetical protein